MIKLIIWDLDDTLWDGTLADGDAVRLVESRAALIRAFNARGVVSSICSKNDSAAARAKLEELGLWDEFVFPHIAFSPKPAAIQAIIADMQLRAPDVLFVDDNPINLNEVRHRIPDIQILDIRDSGADVWLAEQLAEAKGSKSRVPDYRILEAKRADRAAAGGQLSDEDFLRSCEIKACALLCMENLDFVDRIAELINRSNQLNYTQSRVTVEELRDHIINTVSFISLSVFAQDRYGDYGLVGFALLEFCQDYSFRVVHFAFSCRVMHMGLEQYALEELVRRSVGLYPLRQPPEHPSFDRFSRTPCDWIEAMPPVGEAFDAYILSQQRSDLIETPMIRVAWQCQSGGIAHYSSLRSQIHFDKFPEVFSLQHCFESSFDDDNLPPFLVYGAGTEYMNTPWGDLASHLEVGLYQACVMHLCKYVYDHDIRLLVVLPHEGLEDDQYHPWMGLSRDRVKMFNAIWREMFDIYSHVSLVEIGMLHGPEELKDVNHHHPSSLKKIAELIDIWHAQMTAPEIVAEPEQLAA